MVRITADEQSRKALLDFSKEIEVCDEQGRILARVKPVLDSSFWNSLSPPASEDELHRRSKSSEKRYTTQEMLEHLEKL
jgi:hypothetical protein